MVKQWNEANADQQVTAQEIPAGKTSEEVIGAAITAGNTPCLIFNTSPAAVPAFEKQGGLVALDSFSDGVSYAKERSGDTVQQYTSPDGKLYQLPWKSNPVMIFYNKKLLSKAGIDPEAPKLATYDEFLAASRKIVSSGAAPAAIYPAPTSEFFQSWFDFYPMYVAQTGGTPLVKDGKATFGDPAGKAVGQLWRTLYDEKLAPREQYNGDSFAEGKAAMAAVGPWAIASYGDKIDWGVVPVPTEKGMPADQIHTFSDAKNVAMYSACKNRGTAWELMKFATSEKQDRALLEGTGQMPLRKDLPTTYADYFEANPAYATFADQAKRTVEVPNVANSVLVWQTVRDAWSESVIFGKAPVGPTLDSAAQKVDELATAQ